MALFRRTVTASPAPAVVSEPSGSVGAGGIASGADLFVGVDRARAMSIPTVSRARDLLASLIASLPIRQYGTQWTGEELEEIEIQPEPWMVRPDPNTSRAHLLAWTFDDLFFHGRAVWHVTSRYSTGFPASFEWLPWDLVSIDAPMWAGNSPIGGMKGVTFSGVPVPLDDVILFASPIQGLLTTGYRAINTARRLDHAAERFAVAEVPSGWLRQTGGEPMSGDELADLAAGWQEARQTNTIAALNEFVEWHESTMDPSRLQLVEARQYQALELARCANVPPYLVGAPAGTGMTYQNAEQASYDAVRFGALPYIEAIEQTLSGPRITSRGRLVRLDRSGWELGHLDRPTDSPVPSEATR